MCGIFSIVNLRSVPSTQPLVRGTEVIAHRGPDDEGYLLWSGEDVPEIYRGENTDKESSALHRLDLVPEQGPWKVGFGHKRLSILDLSPAGHQPMQLRESGLSITYNGEVYNYIELRKELQELGHSFGTGTDTEVILKAWSQWGESCISRFNGMFAFVILDSKKRKLFAVRDRFGIKPLYYARIGGYFVIASEIKQVRQLYGYTFKLNESIALDYLITGHLDHKSETFDQSIKQLRGGEIMQISLEKPGDHYVKQWYSIGHKPFKGSLREASDEYKRLFTDAVRLRLRADVEIGSCLSGGLDSSAIVCTVSEIIGEKAEHTRQATVTACYEDEKYDEWQYAEAVINQSHAIPYRIWPSFEKLQEDFDKLLWHMDEPFGSTSQFSQWCVFQGAAEAGLKVMLDGQGADEQLAGYGGNDLPLHLGLLGKGKIMAILQEWKGYKRTYGNWPKAQMLSLMKRIIPYKNLTRKPVNTSSHIFNTNGYSLTEYHANDLREHLTNQLLYNSLPALLRYEDRNSMAVSIESRVPFLDHRLVEFTLGLKEQYVYHKGLRKVVLREAMKDTYPGKIDRRRDKMGFVTPEEVWLKGRGKDWLLRSLNSEIPALSDFIDQKKQAEYLSDFFAGNVKFDFSMWRQACFSNWIKSIA